MVSPIVNNCSVKTEPAYLSLIPGITWVTLSKLLSFSEPQFPPLENSDGECPYLAHRLVG